MDTIGWLHFAVVECATTRKTRTSLARTHNATGLTCYWLTFFFSSSLIRCSTDVCSRRFVVALSLLFEREDASRASSMTHVHMKTKTKREKTQKKNPDQQSNLSIRSYRMARNRIKWHHWNSLAAISPHNWCTKYHTLANDARLADDSSVVRSIHVVHSCHIQMSLPIYVSVLWLNKFWSFLFSCKSTNCPDFIIWLFIYGRVKYDISSSLRGHLFRSNIKNGRWAHKTTTMNENKSLTRDHSITRLTAFVLLHQFFLVQNWPTSGKIELRVAHAGKKIDWISSCVSERLSSQTIDERTLGQPLMR